MAANANSADGTFSINEYIAAVPAKEKPKPIPGLYSLALKSAAVAALIFFALTLMAPFIFMIGQEIGQGHFAELSRILLVVAATISLFFVFSLFSIWPNLKFMRKLHAKFMLAPPTEREICSHSWRHGLKVYWYAQLTLFLMTLIFPLATLFFLPGMIVLSPLTIATAVLTGRYTVLRLIKMIEIEKETGI
ncbi:MAG: hypothetical protein PSY14_07705 [bacterium]|nr:hypothetical protein [bacterium]